MHTISLIDSEIFTNVISFWTYARDEENKLDEKGADDPLYSTYVKQRTVDTNDLPIKCTNLSYVARYFLSSFPNVQGLGRFCGDIYSKLKPERMQRQVTEVERTLYEAECEWIIKNLNDDDWQPDNYMISKKFKFEDIDVSW